MTILAQVDGHSGSDTTYNTATPKKFRLRCCTGFDQHYTRSATARTEWDTLPKVVQLIVLYFTVLIYAYDW